MPKSSSRRPEDIDLTVWGLLRSRAHILAFSLVLIGINRAAGLVWPYLSKYLIDDVITSRSRPRLLVLVGAGVLSTIVQGASAYVITRVVDLSAQRIMADLRKRIHAHVSRLPVAYYESQRTGTLVSRIINDIEGVRNVLGGGFASFLGAIATALIAFVILMRIDALMTILVFSALIPFGLLLRNRLAKYRPFFREASIVRAEISGRLTESLAGVRVIKAHRAEASEQGVFADGVDRLMQKVTANIRATAFLDLTVVVVTGVIASVVMYFGGAGMMNGTLTLGDFFRYVMFLGILVTPLVQAVSIGTQFNEAFAGLGRIQEVLAEPREDQDSDRSERIEEIRGEVSFELVNFAYGTDQRVLHEVDFRAEPGTVTALVGPSGAGKSTITALIAGFYKPSQGTIWVDSTDLSRLKLDSYRAHLGIVPQDPFLFSGTIRENVLFGSPGATEEEIMQACGIAHVDEFARRFENSYETLVGERGVKLSMGQRQRVSIARVILANPKILILDEATSSLDSVSEAAIQKALSFLLRDRTTFVIAHRLSTIRRADQILVVDGGRIVERGNHETLLRNKGVYWELYTTQYELQSNLFLAPGEGDSEENETTRNSDDSYDEAGLVPIAANKGAH